MASRFRKLFWTTSRTLKWSFHRTKRPCSQLLAIPSETIILRSLQSKAASPGSASRLQPAQLCRACDAALQAHFRQHHEGARAAAAENRGMDQCVRTEQNDQSRYAGVRESLKSSEHRGALLKSFFIQQRHAHPMRRHFMSTVNPRQA